MAEQTADSTDRAQLDAFVAALRASPHNLLSRRALEELERRHIAESRLFARGLPAGPAQLLDLGTGGGLPGMVIAITRPDLQVTLLDATEKKIVFLRGFAEAHGVDVQLLHGRAEDLAAAHGGRFNLVTARAVAPLERLIPWAYPFLAPGGVLHAIKGERWAEELEAALPVLRRLGARIVGRPSDALASTAERGLQPRVVSIGRPGGR